MKNLASIDIGSHTARMLIAEYTQSPVSFLPLKREREYIRLADGFNKENGFLLRAEAIHQTAEVLEAFVSTLDLYHVRHISAAATGVVRQAVNRDDLLHAIQNKTGISVTIISGEEEARLTSLGVSGSSACFCQPRVIFDLGGGSTEFIINQGKLQDLISTPLGAMLLTQRFLTADPPNVTMFQQLSGWIDGIIGKSGIRPMNLDQGTVIGTGGTVTALAAMIKGVEVRDIRHEDLDRTLLKMHQIVSIFDRLKTMDTLKRSRFTGLDAGRADVILAGIMVVMRILHFLHIQEFVVSLSDLLEGLILDHLRENENER
jgi:exopolyphosphatase/guanosine-5'-triphosphate,3'-diphosphate pyrophosphatase